VKIYHSINDFPQETKTIVTIGTFDGVHKGHLAIIKRINQVANENGLKSVLLTFYPHPRHVLYPEDQKLNLINTIEEKIEILSRTGLDNLVIHKFTKEFSRIKSINFIRDLLVGKLNMNFMIVGFDHHFGKNREGTFENLIELSYLYDFKIEKIEPQLVDGISISSTKIRNAIKEGAIKKANFYLNSNFSILGKVVNGNNIGSKIGFPTANIQLLNKWKILPKEGVYAVMVVFNEIKYFGMLNLGIRPTISDNSFAIEVHIFDFSLKIYDKKLKIEFLERIRDEKKFSDLKKLRLQLEKDKINCEKIVDCLKN